jgi:hypothetical protein
VAFALVVGAVTLLGSDADDTDRTSFGAPTSPQESGDAVKSNESAYAVGAATLPATRDAPLPGPGWSQSLPAYVYSEAELSATGCGADQTKALGASQVDFGFGVNPTTGIEHGHAAFSVWVMSSPAEGAQRIAARADPAYTDCVAEQDIGSIEDAGGANIESLGVARLESSSPFAVLWYRDQIRYSFRGRVQTSYNDRAYVQSGRLVGLLQMERGPEPWDDAFLEEQLIAFKKRLDDLAPTVDTRSL